MIVAPIALFVYNRPWHTEQTLHALMQNELADKSILYIYADGPKENANEETLEKIARTRECIKTMQWCKEVVIIEREINLGLANSIVNGVTEIVNKHGKVIVLEDDLVTSAGFLKYMNDALCLYAKDDKVGCIHGWNYDLDTTDYDESTFFLRGSDCWGWATWKGAWDIFNPDGAILLNAIQSKKILFEFDRKGTHPFVEMLKAQVDGKNDSWAIRWYASIFIADKYCLQPARSIVKNIGFDGSGVHCVETDIAQNPVKFIKVNKIDVLESEWFYKAYNSYVSEGKNGH